MATAVERLSSTPADRLTLFIGAGVSFAPPTSLPVGASLLRELLTLLDPTQLFASEIASYLETRPSMERVLSAMNDGFGYRVDEVYRCVDTRSPVDPREPNENHFYLLDLLRRSACLVTTNQDCCVEMAAGEEGVLKRVVEPVDATSGWNYLKLHGSVDVSGSLDVVLERTSRLPQWKRNLLDEAFARDLVVFVGYGGWDLDILSYLRGRNANDRMLWYEFAPTFGNEHVRQIFTAAFGPSEERWLITGDRKSYRRLFDDLLLASRRSVEAVDHSDLWKAELADVVARTTGLPERRRALATAFMTAWHGRAALAVLENIPGFRTLDWRARADILLDRARAAEQVHDKLRQRKDLNSARRLLLSHRGAADFLQIHVRYLLRKLEYHHSFDERRHVGIAYRMLVPIREGIREILRRDHTHPRLPYYRRLLTYYRAELGYKQGRFTGDRRILEDGARAAEEFVTTHAEDLETLTDALLVHSRILHLLGDRKRAMQQAHSALEFAEQVSKPHSVNAAHKIIGRLAIAAEDSAGAMAHLAAALRIAQRSGDPSMRMRDFLSYALYHEHFGTTEERDRYLEEARRIWMEGHQTVLRDAEVSFQRYWTGLLDMYRC